MNPTARALRGALGAALVAAAAACGTDKADIVQPTVTGGDLFRSYVSLGNSITAGYQSGGINDSTQRESYAYLLAKQMYGSQVDQQFHYPALLMPGCPAPLNSLTGTRVGGAGATDCALRDPARESTTLNNVAVPGSLVGDVSGATPSDPANPLFTILLGGRTQVQRALDARPTFVSLWIGNNDVLDAAVKGSPAPVPGLTAGATAQADFEARYKAIVDSLQTAPTLKGGILIGVVDVTNIPVLFPAQALLNPAFKAGFDLYVGKTTTVLPNCATSAARVSFAIVTFFRSRPASEPAVISCAKGAIPGNPVVGDFFVLDEAEQSTLQTTVAAYNTYIQAKADSIGFAYLDPNALLVPLRQNGAIPQVPNLANPAQPYGEYISVDGVHPARPAHVAVANAIIAAIKAKYPESGDLGTVQ